MSTVHCSFCNGKFSTFNFYIQHLAAGKCGEKRKAAMEADTSRKVKISPSIAQKRKLEETSSSISTAAKKTVTQSANLAPRVVTRAPQQTRVLAPSVTSKNGKARCEFCMKMIKPRGMTQHLNIVHKCSYCDKLVEDVDTHVSNTHLTEACNHCNEKFLDKTRVETHIKEEHLQVCDECEEKFYNKENLDNHIEDVHACEYCDICDAKLRKADNSMDDHKDKEHGIKKKVVKEFGGGMMFMMVAE